jgi:hypothetical protein
MSENADESKLTSDLLLLPLEGFARLLGLALQVNDCGLLLLEGLAQILVRNADLDQFPVVTPDFTRKTECISYVRQDQFTHT